MSNRPEPDPAALSVAHQMLKTPLSLDAILNTPSLRIVLYAVARRHMQRRQQTDIKKLQSNDD